ncbi:MAG: hypothetical protein GY724_07995 [Actinomycetia bacterium]|nr:hypothetical protein [Actinomycetes bacterium]
MIPQSDPPESRPPPVAHVPMGTAEDWEQLRRSVAMLPPRAWALRREEALQALQSLVSCLRQQVGGPYQEP